MKTIIKKRLPLSLDEKGYFPVYFDDKEQLAKKQDNKMMIADIKQSRNIDHHRKFYVLLKYTFSHLPDGYPIYTQEELRKAILYAIGCTESVYDIEKDCMAKQVKSIAFENMNQEEFEKEVYDPALIRFSQITGVPIEEMERRKEVYQ